MILGWDWIMSNLIYINIILAIIIVFFQRRDPKSVWTWLLVLIFIPILGFVLYLFIGADMHKTRLFRTKEIEDELNSTIRSQEEHIQKNDFKITDPLLNDFSEHIFFNLTSSGSIYTENNDLIIYTDGNDKFNALIADINNARHFIHIQYYIIRDDELFDRIKDALIKKVKEGVEVRILYDGMGDVYKRQRLWRGL